MTCPVCGAEGTGNFCASCGAALNAAACASCGATLHPNARFCTQCGTAIGGVRKAGLQPTPRGSRRNLTWYMAGAILLVLGIILIVPVLGDSNDAQTAATPSPGPMQQPGNPPPLTGTPREQADRLYDRIMREREGGDTARAKFFTPMATQAYRNAEPLDDDGLYHLAAVQVVAEDFAGALSTAQRILARNENHLLGLAIAAEAATKGGDTAAARALHQRFLNAYDSEMATGLQEYTDHAPALPEYQRIARMAVGG